MSRSKNPEGSYSKCPRLERGVHFSQLSLLPFYFITLLLSFAHCYTFRQGSSQSLGLFILIGLSCHTPHVAHDNFEDEISGGFMDNDFV